MSKAVYDKNQAVAIAKFQRPHGVKGQILVQSFSSEEGKLFSYAHYFLQDGTEVSFKKMGKHKNGYILAVENYNDRDQVATLVNQEIFVHRAEFGDIQEEDEFYIVDLEGLCVKNIVGEDIGTVNAVHNYGAGDIIEIRFLDSKKTEMFTFDKHHFPHVDIEGGFVTFSPVEEIIVQEQAE